MNAAIKYDILETYHDYEYQDDMYMVESLCNLRVYDLGGIEHYVSLERNKKFGFTLEVINEEDQRIYIERELHPCALESMASFCRRFLHCYDQMMDQMEKSDVHA